MRATLIAKLSVLPSKLPALLAAAPSDAVIEAHPATGLSELSLPAATAEAITEARALAAHFGGTCIIERCPPDVKREIDVFGDAPPSLSLMRAIKAEFDPNRVLSPGRFVGEDLMSDAFSLEDDLSRCVRCGLCLQSCPTYLQTGLETESPRGRLYLMRALADDVIAMTPNAAGHLDQCLQCRNCEAVCPSGVPFGRIMEQTRAHVLESRDAPLSWRLRALFLREVIAKPGRMRVLAGALRLARETGLQSLAERLPVVGPRAALAPHITGRSFTAKGVLASPQGIVKARVALLTGCIMPYAYGRVHRATVRVLARNGCEVSAPAAQVCCGALHAHNGDARTARRLARANIDAFLAEHPDTIVVNSAGCGAAMKEYAGLLADDPAYQDKAREFSARVRDISELLADLPFERPSGSVHAIVTYQDSCHLAHAQRITRAPRHILESIPGLQLVEMAHPDRCCGSAGVYLLTQPAMSLDLLENKLDDIADTGADVIATSNPGCMAQLEAGIRRRGLTARVVHVAELLDRAYRC